MFMLKREYEIHVDTNNQDFLVLHTQVGLKWKSHWATSHYISKIDLPKMPQ